MLGKVDRANSGLVWVGACIWALAAGALLQWWVLPHVLPQLHAGNGLLVGGDWVSFQRIALSLLADMQEFGWSAWELRPDGQAPSGIAAAMYYLIGVSEPYVVLPANAVLFATSAVVLYSILRRLVDIPQAWVGVLPLVVFPSSLMVYGQLHKDVWSIVGVLMVLDALLRLAYVRGSWRTVCLLVVECFVGLVLIWVVRPYLVEISVVAWWAGAAVMGLLAASKLRKPCIRLGVGLLSVLVVQAVALSLAPGPVVSEVFMDTPSTVCSVQGLSGYACRVGRVRQAFVAHYPDADSMIDVHVSFADFNDVLGYLPRAIQIGFFAPFPDTWLMSGNRSSSSWMRMMSGAEMLMAYVAFMGLFLNIVLGRIRNPGLMLCAVAFSMTVMLVYVLAIPNLGSLYRVRLPVWHVFVGIGLCLIICSNRYRRVAGVQLQAIP